MAFWLSIILGNILKNENQANTTNISDLASMHAQPMISAL